MTRPAQHLLMALAFDVYWTLVVMLRERGLLIWLTLAIFAWLRLPACLLYTSPSPRDTR